MREKTRGELEAEITQAVIRFKREFLGRGPLEAKSFLLEDMAIVRLKGVLTAAEQKLAQTGSHHAMALIKQLRAELFELGRGQLEVAIQQVLGIAVRTLHTDVSTSQNESVIVFVLETRHPAG
jgi:uncharacterized protein YbcI